MRPRDARRGALGAIGLAALPAAAVGEVPRYDVGAHCEVMVAYLDGLTYPKGSEAAIRDDCLGSERAAYEGLKRRWDSLGPKLRAHCDELATEGTPGSYALLQGCVAMIGMAGAADMTDH